MRQSCIALLTFCFFSFHAILDATPIRLTVRPKGTNQVEITFGPVVPGAAYQVLARTNSPDGHWLNFGCGFIGPSNGIVAAACPLGGEGELKGLSAETFRFWTFVAGWWDDTTGDSLPPLYKELVLRSDPYSPGDPYGCPMGDGWSTIEKLRNNMDPLRASRPPVPRVDVAFYDLAPRQPLAVYTNPPLGKAVVTVEDIRGPLPDYILIEKAERKLRQPPRAVWSNRFTMGPRTPFTNRPGLFRPSFNRTNRAMPMIGGSNALARTFPTNRPPFIRNPSNSFLAMGTNQFRGRTYFDPRYRFNREDMYDTGPFQEVARIHTQAGVQKYTYVETNVSTFAQPLYRASPHYNAPSSSCLASVDAKAIRETQLTVQARAVTGGYNLTALDPIPYGRYLLLVRDRHDTQWRASGYFAAGTNQEPVELHVDSKGMMSQGQAPIAMPELKFLSDVTHPEFTAGWGEDSDGDGLPDIYEVLVTGTDPINADTGATGVLDGYKEASHDGWSNLEKFRRRADPLKPSLLPKPVLLKEPTLAEVLKTLQLQSDFHYEPRIEVRVAGTSNFQPIKQAFWLLHRFSDPHDPEHVRGNFDLRLSWIIPQPEPQLYGVEREEASWTAMALMMAARGEPIQRANSSKSAPRIHSLASRREVESYAARHKTFEPAIEYAIAALDGRRPAQLPAGVTLSDVTNAIHAAFPEANVDVHWLNNLAGTLPNAQIGQGNNMKANRRPTQNNSQTNTPHFE